MNINFTADEKFYLLAILRKGLTVEFPNGDKLVGDSEVGYIEPIKDGVSLGLWDGVSLGLWDMSLNGLNSGLKDLENEE